MVLRPELKGLQVLVADFDTTALQGLAGSTSVQITAAFGTLGLPFLAKQFRVLGKALNFASDDQCIFFLATGSPSIAEVDNAIEGDHTDPQDPTFFGNQSQAKLIIWNSIVAIPMVGQRSLIAEADANYAVDSGWLSLGSKGIPFDENHGPHVDAYNTSSLAMDGSAGFDGIIIIRGVFLNG